MIGSRTPSAMAECRPLAISERLLLLPPIHTAAQLLACIGLRDRLRCPSCNAVGTWKPHGSLTARIFRKGRWVRRWLCKWCGHYIGPEGRLQAFPDQARGFWALPRPYDPDSPETPGPTPAEALKAALPKTWPWRG